MDVLRKHNSLADAQTTFILMHTIINHKTSLLICHVLYKSIRKHADTDIYAHIYADTDIYAYIYADTDIYAYIYAHTDIYAYIYADTDIYAYIYTRYAVD